MARTRSHDWETIRAAYVAGQMTLQSLSREHGGAENAPTYSSLRKVAARDNWKEQREAHQKRSQEVKIDIQEMSQRHLKLGKAMQSIAIQALKQIDFKTISARDATNLAKLGINIERLYASQAASQNAIDWEAVDWASLPDEDLEKIINGEVPDNLVPLTNLGSFPQISSLN